MKSRLLFLMSMTIRRKTIIVVTVIVAAAIGAVALLLPVLSNPDRYRPQVISYLQEKTGKQVEIGRLARHLFPLSIHLDDFGVRNPQIFPPGYVVKVARMDAEIDVAALLHRQVVIKSLVLEDPVMNLTSDPDGPWNFENPNPKFHKNTPSSSRGDFESQISGGNCSVESPAIRRGRSHFFRGPRDLGATLEQVNLMGIMNPSSSSMDGQGSLKAGLLRFGAGRGKKSGFQIAVAGEARFFHGCQSGGLWRKCRG